MKILWKYYLREFFKIFGIVAFGLAMIFSILDLLEKIDELERGRVTVMNLGSYVFLNIPKYLYYLFPMMLLICGLFIISQASRYRELIAFKATGGKLRRLFLPFLIMGISFSVLGFIIGEVIVPDFAERTLELKKEILKNREKVAFQKGALWMRGTDGSLVRIGGYIPQSRIIQNISIFTTDEDRVKQRIEAENAFWNEDGPWKLRNVTIYDMETGEIQYTPELQFPSLESPDFFGKVTRKPEEMGIGELYDYTQRLQAAGFSDRKLLVDLNSKLSYPIANFFMLVLGVSLSVIGRAGGGLFATGLGIAISFIYWFAYTLMLSMGYAGIVPPEVAPWAVPLVFGIVSFSLFRQIPE
ncbi:MAG: LptF/LptG family permease [Thermodesulfovibrionales bacterium]|nr:LptF/LptG family permease [Thermodesulfovibrionales bacterium]